MSIPNANVELLQCSLWVLVNLWQMISLEDTISGVAPTIFHDGLSSCDGNAELFPTVQ